MTPKSSILEQTKWLDVVRLFCKNTYLVVNRRQAKKTHCANNQDISRFKPARLNVVLKQMVVNASWDTELSLINLK